jgi:hypothetical protein
VPKDASAISRIPPPLKFPLENQVQQYIPQNEDPPPIHHHNIIVSAQMLALLSNCIGHIYMSVFSRFWSRAAKRRQQQANCRGGSGGAEGVDDSEFVRIEGRAKARTDTLKSAESVDDGADQQHYHSSEARGSPHQTHQHHQMAQAPVIRIEQSGADNEFPPEAIVKIDSTKKESIDCQEATTTNRVGFDF